MWKDRKQQKGFTLLEITAVLGIVTVAMLGITSLLNQSLRTESQHQHYVTASMLAQEGIEVLRNKRDRNWLTSGIDWLDTGNPNSSNDLIQNGSYTLEYDGTIDASVDSLGEDDARLFIDGSGFYTHDDSVGNTLTPYRRLIEVADNGSNIDATSTVQWTDRGQVKKYEISTKLYDWR